MKRWLRRLSKIALSILAILVVLAVGAYLFRDRLLAKPLARLAAAQLSRALGGTFRLGRVEGDWFGRVVLRDLATTTPPPEGVLVGIAFRQVSVDYRLRELLFGDPLPALRRIEVEALELTLDLTRPPVDPDAPPPSAQAILDALPRPLPAFVVMGGVTLRTREGALAARELRLEGAGETLELLLAGLSLPESFGPPPPRFTLRLAREGPYGLSVETDDAIAGVRLREARADLGAGLAGSLLLDAAGGTVTVSGSPQSATFLVHALDLALLPAPLLRLAGIEAGIAGRLEASGKIGPFADMAFQAKVEVRDAAFDVWRAESVHLDGSWRLGRGHLETLEVITPRGFVRAHRIAIDPALPYRVGGIGELTASVPDVKAFLAGLPGERALPLPRAPVSLDLVVTRGAEGRVEVERAIVACGASMVIAEGGALLQERPESWRETVLDLTFDATLHDLEHLLDGVAGAPALVGGLRATGSMSGTLGAPRAEVRIDAQALLVEGRLVRKLEFRGGLSGARLGIELLQLDAEPGSLTLSGVADLETRSLSDASFSFAFGDLAGMARMVPGAPALEGNATGEGTVARGSLGGDWTGAVRVEARAVGVDGTLLGDASVRAEAAGRRIELIQCEIDGPLGRARTQGVWTLGEGGGEGTLYPLEAEREGIRLVCLAPLAVSWGKDGVAMRDLRASLWGGSLEGSALWGERIEARLKGEGLSLPAFLGELRGEVGFLLEAAGPADAPAATLHLKAQRLEARGVAGAMELLARQDAGGLIVEKLEAVSGARRITGTAHLPWNAGRSGLRSIEGGVRRLDLVASAPDLGEAGQIGLSGRDLSLRIEADGDRLGALMSLMDLAYRAPGRERIEVPGETRISIESGVRGTAVSLAAGGRGPLFLRGDLTSGAPFAWAAPLEAWDSLLAGGLAGTIEANLPDLAKLLPLLPMLARLEGNASVQFALGGSVGAPRWTGVATIACPAVRLAGDLPSLQDLTARVAFEGGEARIERFEGLLGYETFRIEGGAHLRPDGAPALDLRLSGKNLLLARTPTLRLRADVDIALAGLVDALAASGSVVVTDALYSRAISLLSEGRAAADDKLQLFAIREGPLARLTLDLDVQADETIRIENNIARGLLSANLHLGGTGAVPVPQGRIDFRDLTVRIPVSGTRLKVERGQLSFPPEDPFTPRLVAGARTRMQGYDLSVAVSGSVSELEVFVSSVPPLPTEDAFLLLTTGTLPKDLERKGGSAALSMAGNYLGERLLEWLSGPSDPDQESFFDRFTAEVGRDVSVTGQPTVGAEFRLTERWFLAGGRDKYDDYNAGVLLRLRFR